MAKEKKKKSVLGRILLILLVIILLVAAAGAEVLVQEKLYTHESQTAVSEMDIFLNGAALCQAGFPLRLQGPTFLLLQPLPQMAPPEDTEAQYCKKKHKQYPRGSDNSGFDPRLRQQFLQLCFEPGSPVQFHGFRGSEANGGVYVSFNLYGCRAEYGPGRDRCREVTELHIRYDLNILLVRVFREEERNFFRRAENGGSIADSVGDGDFCNLLPDGQHSAVGKVPKGPVVKADRSGEISVIRLLGIQRSVAAQQDRQQTYVVFFGG